ncbi:group 1 glycosyl transferase [Flavobacterium kingsejongi]|uniref:Group 1 glycosyl transferase n=2 Tax=Flavobacterium kingsejongi TaxID=1678728 RepID=A0A2S1LU68_9FLAO|nr:group 1 glycosyl transferase [Flavobacterium kingsejongi]
MDYFFWLFDQECSVNMIDVDWFFPNAAQHGAYSKMNIIATGNEPERFFIAYCKEQSTAYTHVITHFIALCTPFFKEVKQLTKARIIGVDHNPRPVGGYPLRKKVEKRIKGFLFSRYIDCFVGVSEYTVQELTKDFGPQLSRKTIRIYNGVLIDGIKKHQYRSEQEPLFMVASHLRESKGIQDLIEAVVFLPDTVKAKLKIDVYGDGPYGAVLRKKVQSHKLDAIFCFKGNSPDLKSTYCLYDYMLQPTHMECFSLSILESLAANVPVITTNVGGNEEVIESGKNGFVYTVKDIVALKELLLDLFSGEKRITIDTRSLIEEGFSLELMVKNHFKLLS